MASGIVMMVRGAFNIGKNAKFLGDNTEAAASRTLLGKIRDIYTGGFNNMIESVKMLRPSAYGSLTTLGKLQVVNSLAMWSFKVLVVGLVLTDLSITL